jgi:hypothetical protein
MALLDLVLGRPLASSEDKTERVGPLSGMSVFGLDALSSAAYGPEAALTILIPLGIAGLKYSFPITAAVAAILAIVYFSYRQTIAAYPSGAGSYTVAKENLGVTDRLIPLFAVGAFLAFTLSQSGMVMHWLKSSEPSARLNAAINGVGALATGTTFVIVIETKFAEGAWLVVIVIPALFFLMHRIKRHYLDVAEEIAISGPIRLEPWNRYPAWIDN